VNALVSFLRMLKRLLVRVDQVARYRKLGAKIGERVAIQRDVILDYSHSAQIEIGDDVTLAPRVHIMAHDASTKRYLGYTRIGKVKIGNRVFIGANSMVLPGTVIGDDVIVGAGSVVCRDIPPGCVAVGNPAKVVSSIEDFLRRRKMEMEALPRFGIEYRADADLTGELRAEMNATMKDQFGYIV